MRQIGISTTGNPIVELTHDEMLKFSAFAKSLPEWFSILEARLKLLESEPALLEQKAQEIIKQGNIETKAAKLQTSLLIEQGARLLRDALPPEERVGWVTLFAKLLEVDEETR